MTPKPQPGDVFRYAYLWKRQQQDGETEGRKSRPACIAVTMATAEGDTVLFILPLTTQPPMKDRLAIAVPAIEARRAGLDSHRSIWVILDELNTDVFERSYALEDRERLGAFSRKFTNQLTTRLLQIVKDGGANIVPRTD